MTKKHFEAIANIIADNAPFDVPGASHAGEKTRETLANELADYFQRGNLRFNRERFLQACNVSQKIYVK